MPSVGWLGLGGSIVPLETTRAEPLVRQVRGTGSLGLSTEARPFDSAPVAWRDYEEAPLQTMSQVLDAIRLRQAERYPRLRLVPT